MSTVKTVQTFSYRRLVTYCLNYNTARELGARTNWQEKNTILFIYLYLISISDYPQAKSKPGSVRGDFSIHIGRCVEFSYESVERK